MLLQSVKDHPSHNQEKHAQPEGGCKGSKVGHLCVIEHVPIAVDDVGHGVEIENGEEFLRNDRFVVHDGGEVHPRHGNDAEDMFKVFEIDRHCGCKQSHTDCKEVFDRHDDGQAEQSKGIQPDTGKNNNCENDKEAQEHIDKAACHIGDRDDLTGEIDLFDEVFLCNDACRTAGDGGGEEDPRNEGNEEIEVVFFDAAFEDERKDDGIDHQLEKGVDERPEKAQNAALITSTQILFDQTEDHLAISIEFFDLLYHKSCVLLLLYLYHILGNSYFHYTPKQSKSQGIQGLFGVMGINAEGINMKFVCFCIQL